MMVENERKCALQGHVGQDEREKNELKEKDSIISRLKFAQEVTLQQMCELQDDILASNERENNLKLQLEALKTQLVYLNLQVAVKKNKELKAENEDLRRQLGCKSPTTSLS